MSEFIHRTKEEIMINDPVIRLLDRVWIHPLLTEDTVAHRAQFPAQFEEYCRQRRLDSTQVCAIPVGSSLWIVSSEGQSDWDMLMYTNDLDFRDEYINQHLQRMRRECPDLPDNRLLSLTDEDPDSKCQSFGIAAIGDRNLKKFVPLLLTPDNFIAGNVEIARELRQYLLSQVHPSQDGELEKAIQEQFETYMKSWPDADFSGQSKRYPRYLEALGNKAKNTRGHHITRTWALFKKNLDEIQPPTATEFRQLLTQTNGSLVLPHTYEPTT